MTPKLDDVARMSDVGLGIALRRALRGGPRYWFASSDYGAIWLIESMGRRGCSCNMAYGKQKGIGWVCGFFSEKIGMTIGYSHECTGDRRKLTFCRAVSEAALRALRSLKAHKNKKE